MIIANYDGTQEEFTAERLYDQIAIILSSDDKGAKEAMFRTIDVLAEKAARTAGGRTRRNEPIAEKTFL
jgi:hypothetical protein